MFTEFLWNFVQLIYSFFLSYLFFVSLLYPTESARVYVNIPSETKRSKRDSSENVGMRGRGAAEEILITNRGIIIRGGNLVELSRRVATSLHATSPPGHRPALPLHRHRIDLAYQYTGESRGKHLTKKLTIFQNPHLLDFSTAFKKFLSDDKQKIHPVTFDELP